MTVLTTSAGRLDARPTSRTAGFRVELLRDWRQAVARWQDSSPSTPFQHPQWYDAWYSAFADAEGIEPLIAVVTDASTGEPVVLRTQTANEHSMRLAAKLGFTEVERFEAYGAEQWFGVWSSATPSG